MSNHNARFSLAVVLAGLAGFLRGGMNANSTELVETQPFSGFEFSLTEIGLLVSTISVFSLLATIGVFGAGYWWAGQADLPTAYGQFAVSLFVAAVAGYGLSFLPLSFQLTDHSPFILFTLFVTGALSLIVIPVTGLAGGAIAQYRSVTKTP